MNYKFCNFSTEEKSGIVEILNTCFHVNDFDKILNTYKVFTENFNSPDQRPKIEGIERRLLVPKTNNNKFIENFNDLNFQIGIDLPILLRPYNFSSKTIFIVAEDPLRNFIYPQSDIILSTPFGTHLENCRINSLHVYWEITQNLLNNGYNVYLTDILKLWLKRENGRKERIDGELLNNFHSALYKEIELFKPQLIVTYGSPAAKLIYNTKLNTEIKTISFAHPTPTANGSWKKILVHYYNNESIRCTADNKINYINAAIDKKCDIEVFT